MKSFANVLKTVNYSRASSSLPARSRWGDFLTGSKPFSTRTGEARPAVKLILLDVFDTLLRPTKPPWEQYYLETLEVTKYKSTGRPATSDKEQAESFKRSFKQAFLQTSKAYPIYGKNLGLSNPDEWWSNVIDSTLIGAGYDPVQVRDEILPELVPRLLSRFSSSRAYQLFDDVLPFLEKVRHYNESVSQSDVGVGEGCDSILKLSIATNSDSRILLALEDLGLPKDLISLDGSISTHEGRGLVGPTLSYEVGFEKPSKEFFLAACRKNNLSFPDLSLYSSHPTDGSILKRVLYVGDQLYEDFWGSHDAGLSPLWLQRDFGESNQPASRTEEGGEGRDPVYLKSRTIRSLEEVLDFV
ncbi:hypothetical protein IE53DRAFT_384626 [Violaceomyces palustris]|uniref:Uncharacterized protein n=1 Tax=Violaceomyces palustris TaxID=1673888 RepID=A0ACD0P4I6_9BASI|nr:hypothetical protein IE53DRAFT_384626 [Violaceomyces palustris]